MNIETIVFLRILQIGLDLHSIRVKICQLGVFVMFTAAKRMVFTTTLKGITVLLSKIEGHVIVHV